MYLGKERALLIDIHDIHWAMYWFLQKLRECLSIFQYFYASFISLRFNIHQCRQLCELDTIDCTWRNWGRNGFNKLSQAEWCGKWTGKWTKMDRFSTCFTGYSLEHLLRLINFLPVLKFYVTQTRQSRPLCLKTAPWIKGINTKFISGWHTYF